MNAEFFAALGILEKEKGIPKEYMLEKVEAALLSAYKKDNANNANVRVVIDESKKEIKLMQIFEVVEQVENKTTQMSIEEAQNSSKMYTIGDTIEQEVKTKNFGRISAQTAKQVIIQGIREAERGMLIKEYENKKEEVISARVIRTDRETGNTILDMGKSEATLMRSEQIPGEVLLEGSYVKVYVIEVRKESKGPLVTISRTHPGLVKRLFELEIPEIQDGTVLIKSLSREAGSRTKIAVYSNNPDVDAVGACIGNKGIRINNIVNELSGEKIDVVKFSPDSSEYITAALSPATVLGVLWDTDKACRAIVPDDQLSLAIGKEGQNARLAAKMTGCKIDIKTQSQMRI